MLFGIFYHDIQFFRFYEDGFFLDCLIRENEEPIRAEQIQSWFQPNNSSNGIVRGCYTFRDKRVSFRMPGHFGHGYLIDYEGKHEKDHLVLNSLDHNTGRNITNRVFIRLL
jgi:hypothetical protein